MSLLRLLRVWVATLSIGMLVFTGIVLFTYEIRTRTMWRKQMGDLVNIEYRDIEQGKISANTSSLREPHVTNDKYFSASSNHDLKNEVRVLIFVLTSSKTASERLSLVQETWGRRSNKILYLSSNADSNMSIIGLGGTDGYETLWGKTKRAFSYVYNNHLNDADWFMKVDDDTYVVVENLRRMLRGYNASKPLFFGHRFRYPSSVRQSYMSGGGGYVLSKAALARFVRLGLPNAVACEQNDMGAEDYLMGRCLERVGVVHGDSRDSRGRQRFLPLSLFHHFNGNYPKWMYEYEYYPLRSGRQCCSDSLVSAHYVRGNDMHLMDYLIYGLNPE
uniref:N-acetylgalactosaminide beta-1,3-galactosyltransferase n=1 Tax=Saccoglossus kowalevskii TaxID=10224 RepID=A0ABM0GQ27_SACKO|nr:PREDICTED: glycoprotein-N-acetylgalactosamine 3-beta-galactosyltransferase 1-like [Saccoglossus kowalevskii]